MASYPAPKRSGQIETLMYAERERLFDRGMTRDQMNDLMERLQAKLGSKNKLAEAIYERKNAASRVKQLVDGAQRYTDTVIDRILVVASDNDVPKILEGEIRAEEERDAAEPPVDTQDAATEEPAPKEPAPEEAAVEEAIPEPSAVPPTEETAEAPAENVEDQKQETPAEHQVIAMDWLAGVRGRREEFVRQMTEHEDEIAARRAEISRIEGEIERITARRDATVTSVGEIDSALSILQAI